MDNDSDPPEIMLETKWKGMQNSRWFKCSKLIDKMQHGADIVADYIKKLEGDKKLVLPSLKPKEDPSFPEAMSK